MECKNCYDPISEDRIHKKNVKFCSNRCYKEAQLDRSKKQYLDLKNKPSYKDRNEEMAAAMILLKDFRTPISKSKLEKLGFSFPVQMKGRYIIAAGDLFTSTSNMRNITFHKMDAKVKEIAKKLNLSFPYQP